MIINDFCGLHVLVYASPSMRGHAFQIKKIRRKILKLPVNFNDCPSNLCPVNSYLSFVSSQEPVKFVIFLEFFAPFFVFLFVMDPVVSCEALSRDVTSHRTFQNTMAPTQWRLRIILYAKIYRYEFHKICYIATVLAKLYSI